MKIFLVLLWSVTFYCCYGYPVVDGEISEEISAGNDTSDEYWVDATNDTSYNDTLLRHGFFKKVGGGIKNIKNKGGNFKNKIGSIKDNSGLGKSIGGGHYIRPGIRTNPGSGVKDPENAKWALLGIGLVLVVTVSGLSLYYYQTRKRKRNTQSHTQFQQINNQ